MYYQSLTYQENAPLIKNTHAPQLYNQPHLIHNDWSRTYGLNGGGFGNLLGMGSSIASTLGHKELGGMLGMANSFVGKYGKHFTGLGNGLSTGGFGGLSGYPGAGLPTSAGGFGSGFPAASSAPGFMGGGFPSTMAGPGLMGSGYPGAMGGLGPMTGGPPGAMGMTPGFFF